MNKNLRLLSLFSGSIFAFSLLTNKEKKKLIILTLAGVLISILDIFALGLISITLNFLTNSDTNVIIETVKNIFFKKIEMREVQEIKNFIVIILFIFAAVLLITKTTISVFSQYIFAKNIVQIHSNVSEKFTRAFFENSIEKVTRPISHEVSFVLNHGLFYTINVTLGAVSSLVIELFLIISIFIALCIWNPLISVVLFIYFSAFMYISLIKFSKKAQILGEQATSSYIKGNKLILESIRLHRELWVMGQHTNFNREITNQVRSTSFGYSMQNFLSQLPKSTFEVAIVLGLGIFSFIGLLSDSKDTTLTGLVIFLIAGLRLGPSLVKLLGSIITLKAMQPNINRVKTFVYENISDLRFLKSGTNARTNSKISKFIPLIELVDVNYKYPENSKLALNYVNISIDAFQMIGITGETGSGKSTLIDICLGMKTPTSGRAMIGGVDAKLASKIWPRKIAMLSQKVSLIDGNAAENIAIGNRIDEIDLGRVNQLIDELELRTIFPESDKGVLRYIGEDGFKLSGGQRQRLGLARALYWNPSMLILDELNSSQDEINSGKLNKYLKNLSKTCTIIIVSHKKSDLDYCDKLIEIKDGQIMNRKS